MIYEVSLFLTGVSLCARGLRYSWKKGIDPFLEVFSRKAEVRKKSYIYTFFILISETCQDWGK